MFTVTQEMVDDAILCEVDYKLGEKTTIVLLKLRNGFEVVGTSGCIDPANYNHEIGKKYARERAIQKVWELEAYLLQSKQEESLDNLIGEQMWLPGMEQEKPWLVDQLIKQNT